MKLSGSVLRLAIVILLGCVAVQAAGHRISNGKFSFALNNDMSASIYLKANGHETFLCGSKSFFDLKAGAGDVVFPEKKVTIKQTGNVLRLTAQDATDKIRVSATVAVDKKFAHSLLVSFDIVNISRNEITLTRTELTHFTLDAQNFGADSAYKFETFQGGTYISRPDWVFPLTKDYARGNFMGNNSPDYGGGIPAVDFWTKKQGIAFASLAMQPELISLPVAVTPAGTVSFSITDDRMYKLLPGEHLHPVSVAIIVHQGDYYNALQEYSSIMQSRGLQIPISPATAREPEWCAWGYGREFSYNQLLTTLPIASSLNFKWATLDDGWQDADGDWGLSKEKFPNGMRDFKAFVDLIHAKGMKARLWWVPLTAGDSAYNEKVYPKRMSEYAMKVQSKLAKEHPDWFILDKDGNRYQVEWWNTYVLDPSLPEVREYYKQFLIKVITEWGFDGLKIDGQNMNAVPPCYNPAHHHKSPYESCEAVPKFFEMIYKTIYALKDSAVIQLCPCGTNFSLYNIPWTTQFVASDPTSSWQVRHRGKTFRALVGNKIPCSGDHVELTNCAWDDNAQRDVELKGKAEDFASTVGVGGVIASKFTAPGIAQQDSLYMLTPGKEAYYRKWMAVADREKINEGEYLNLYDIAFDIPETHVLKKAGTYYYSFFSDKPFNGSVELRGLPGGKYEVTDCVDHKIDTEIMSSHPFIAISFSNHLLLKVIEEK